MSIRKIWKTKEQNIDNEFLALCGNNRVLAVLLSNRGINTEKKIHDFLNPTKGHFSSADNFIDMPKCISRIKTAIDNKENITIYGDFDADGITSTAILYKTLKEVGANVNFYLPDRDTESHGLNTKALIQIISKKKSKLIITVDCGISNVTEVNFAKGFKTDIIITDHHEPPEILPEAFAILNPKAENSLVSDLPIEELESLNYLSGAGVAFKLACKLLEIYNKKDFVHEILPIAAIGTIGDVVELIGENRSIAAMGIELIKRGKHKGIQKIIKSMGIENTDNITSETIAFGIVPRLNAAGRLESASSAITTLISNNDIEIDESIEKLNKLNLQRQDLCDETYEQAKSMYEKEKSYNKKSIILYNENWHIGIIGIVCSKLVETYNVPAFLMTKDNNNPNIIRCSCRSIQGINIHNILSQHKDIFEGFGGHKMAAGFSFDNTKIKFQDFKNLLNKTIDEFTQDIDFSKITLEADMIIDPQEINLNTIDIINKLQPFGSANPPPLFIMNDLTLNHSMQMGTNGNHIKLFASKNDTNNIECIKWNCNNLNLAQNSKFNILFCPRKNEFNGNTTIQYIINDLQGEFINNEDHENFEIKILDHRNKKNILNQVINFINSTKKTTTVFIKSPKLQKEIENNINTKNFITNEFDLTEEKEQLMFFECPISTEQFINIIYKAKAKIIHLMNFNIHEINTNAFLTTLSGMLKYAVSNLQGRLELKRLSNALNVNEEIIETALNLFEEAESIDLHEVNENEYKITFFKPTELSKLTENELYTDLNEKILEINKFINFYLNADINEIKKIISG